MKYFFTVLFLLCVSAPSNEVSPDVFREWEPVPETFFEISIPNIDLPVFTGVLKNPDESDSVKGVRVYSCFLGGQAFIFMYEYFDGVNILRWVFDTKTGSWNPSKLTESERTICVSCHDELSGQRI